MFLVLVFFPTLSPRKANLRQYNSNLAIQQGYSGTINDTYQWRNIFICGMRMPCIVGNLSTFSEDVPKGLDVTSIKWIHTSFHPYVKDYFLLSPWKWQIGTSIRCNNKPDTVWNDKKDPVGKCTLVSTSYQLSKFAKSETFETRWHGNLD